MADDTSIRDDIEQDLQDTKDAVKQIAKPITDKVKDEVANEIGDRIAKQVAEQAAKTAAQTTAESAAVGGVGGTAAGTVAEGAGAATSTGATATAATAETMAGAGTATAAGEATAVAASAGGTAAAGAVAEGAAVGAAAGPAGVAAGAVAGVALGVLSAVHKEMQISMDESDPDAPKINALVLFVAAFLFFMVFCATLISKGISGVFSIGQETQFEQDIVYGEDMSPAGEHFKEGMSEDKLEYDYEMPLASTINMYVYGKNGDGITDGFRAALHKAIDLHCKNLIEQLDGKSGGIRGKPYNSERSLESFYSNPYPYDLATTTFQPKIGDVLHAEGYSQSYRAKYDDVNYAEVIAILSMSTEVEGSNFGFTWGNANFEDFMEFTDKEECYQNLYELGLKWVPIYEGDKIHENEDGTTWIEHLEKDGDEFESPEDCRAALEENETIEEDGVILTFSSYYVKVEVRPFGLRELFSMAFGGNPDAAANAMHVHFYDHTNLYMLNYSERVTRMYQRNQKTIIHTTNQGDITVDSLGPSYRKNRSVMSSIYTKVANDPWLTSQHLNGCGRSCWYYIEKTYNDKFEEIVWPDDPVGSEPPGGDFVPPDNAKILDMYEYINQGDYPNTYRGSSGETVAKSGCLDCSVDMIVMYYLRQHIPITDISQYVGSSGALDTATALGVYGLTQGSNVYSGAIDTIIDEINNDRPCILHIRGYWTSADGKVLHGTQNGHFLVGIGYDETGIYVHDPGKRSNYHIDYADWSRVNDFYCRPVYN